MCTKRSTVLEFQKDCPYVDQGSIAAWSAFLYGVAVTSPYNFITLTLPFFEDQMPDYPISYVVTFAVNGVMVLVVIVSLAKPHLASHSIKINLSIFLSGLLTLILPIVVDKTQS